MGGRAGEGWNGGGDGRAAGGRRAAGGGLWLQRRNGIRRKRTGAQKLEARESIGQALDVRSNKDSAGRGCATMLAAV